MERFQHIVVGASLAVTAVVAVVATITVIAVVVAHFWPALSLLEPLDDEATELKRSAERFAAAEDSGWQA